MFGVSIVVLSFLLRLLILLRGYFSHLFREYIWFYYYIACTLAADVAIDIGRWLGPAAYLKVYWPCQFITLAVGCGLVLEIFKHVLAEYPGAERFAKAVCVGTFGLIFLAWIIYPRRTLGLQAVSIELEKDVRTAQIFFFAAVVAVIFYYYLPLSRNVRGMLFGYGVYLGVSLVSLAVRSYVGRGFDSIWRIAQPLAFDGSLLIWLVAFWAYYPNPLATHPIRLESDYDALATLTNARIHALRTYLGRSLRE